MMPFKIILLILHLITLIALGIGFYSLTKAETNLKEANKKLEETWKQK